MSVEIYFHEVRASGTLITSAEVLGLYFAKSFDHAINDPIPGVPHRIACSQMSLQLGTTTTNCLHIASLLFQLLPRQPKWPVGKKIVNKRECESLYRDSCEWQAKFSEVARIAEVSFMSSGISVNGNLNFAIC